jgi:hypothetical protein
VKSVAFRREREDTWVELEGLIERVERSGLSSLSPAEVSRLPIVYRATLSGLSVARAISLDASLLAYLESLGARSYVAIYSPRPTRWPRPAISCAAASRARCTARGDSSRWPSP